MMPTFNLTPLFSTSRVRRVLVAGLLSGLVGLSACGGGSDPVVDRGPTTLPVSAALNGLFWDKGDARLFLTDETANAIRVWDGDKGFPLHAALPNAPASGASLGQLTRTADGTLYVTRFGFGTDGAVIAVPKTGAAVNLGGTDSLRRRIGITTAPDGALIDGWFVKGGSGAVSQLTVTGTQAVEKDLITGLGKPVGLAAVNDTIYVSDQNTGNVLSFSLSKARAQTASLSDGTVVATFTTLDGIDLMTAAADGTLFFGGTGGKLFKVSPTGTVSTLATGWPKIKGVTFDPVNRRLFAAVSAADATSTPTVRIVPID